MLRQTVVASALAVAAAAALVANPPVAPAAQSAIGVTCTFANPSYAGDCVERTIREEAEKPAAACKPILDCLNNAHCVKNYCQATTIRQGWRLKKAE